MRKILLIILVAGLLVACSKAPETPAPAAPAPVVEPPATTGTNTVLGPVDKSSALDVDSVRCDLQKREITFRFQNNDNQSRSWQMDQQVGWNGPKDLVAVRVFVNSYEVNGRSQPIYNGEKLFGPNWPFSKNCGGVDVLKPGQDVTCTLSPVPFKTANQLIAGHNEIFIDSPSSHHIIQFECSS